MDLKEHQIRRKTIYEGSFISMYEDDIELPNKKYSKRIVVDHVGAAAIVPMTSENEVILVKQYRYAISQVSLEIPAGKKDFRGEDAKLCAIRELEEETGHQAKRIEKIHDIHTAIGFSNEMIELFVGYECFPVKNPLKGDIDEFLEVVKIPFKDTIKMIHEGLITDAKTVVALTYLENRHANQKKPDVKDEDVKE